MPRDVGAVTRLRAVLSSRSLQLQTMVAQFQQELRATTAAQADAADLANASSAKSALHQQAEHAARQLRVVREALRRIDADNYGDCMMCGALNSFTGSLVRSATNGS